MHTQVEICSLADIEHAVELLVAFVQSFDERTDFRPFHFRG
jgi:putative aminopeptidase FrvX